jgi:hypothetical protein
MLTTDFRITTRSTVKVRKGVAANEALPPSSAIAK